MPKFVASPESVSAISGNGNQQWWQVEGQDGLVVEVSRAGKKTWTVRKDMNGKKVRHLLFPVSVGCGWEEIEKAGKLGRDAVELIMQGIHPADEAKRKQKARQAEERTVAEVWEIYRRSPKWASRRGNTQSNYEVMWRKRLEPDLGALIMKDIMPTQFLDIRQGWLERDGHGAARSTVMAWNGMWRFARSAALIPRQAMNPAQDLADLAPNWSAVGRRDEDIPDERLGDFWWATYDLKPNVGDLVRFMMLTGLRSSEARLLKWDEVDATESLITLEPDRVKNGRRFVFPFSELADDMIANRQIMGHQRPRALGDHVTLRSLREAGVDPRMARMLQKHTRRRNPYVFGDPKRETPPDHPRIAVQRVCALIGMEPVVAHTLRHVYARLAREAVGIAFVPALLNHSIGHVTEAVYASMQLKEHREKAEIVSRHIWEVINRYSDSDAEVGGRR